MLFAAMSVIWGTPYLLVKVAVKELSPSFIVCARTALAAIVLVAIAAKHDALRPALRRWPWILAFSTIEMGVPWLLVANAERRLPSGITGLLIACVPLAASIAGFFLGEAGALRPIRLLGIAIGFAGVAVLVSRDLGSRGAIPWGSVLAIMLVCVGYATAPFIADRKLYDVPTIGVIGLSLSFVAIAYLPAATISLPDHHISANAWWSVLGLAVICTGVAFVAFFALIAEVGPSRATLITFVNPAVAITLGAVFLSERITLSTIGGFALVLTGCWCATRPLPQYAALVSSSEPVADVEHANERSGPHATGISLGQ